MGIRSGRLHDAVTQGELTAVEAQLSSIDTQLAQIDQQLYVRLYNQDTGLRKYRSAVAKIKSGTVQISNACFIGDSITEGVGVTGAENRYTKGFVGIIRTALTTLLGDVGSGMVPVYAVDGVNAWTFSAGWENNTFGIAAEAKSTSTINETAQISFNGTGIVFVVLKSASRGNVSVAIDGGAPTVLSCNAAVTAQGTISVTGLGAGDHTAILTNAEAKSVTISGAYAIKGTTGIRVNMVGRSGASAATFTATDFTLAASIDVFSPVLTVIGVITNEIGSSVAIATFTEKVQAIITRAKTFGDVIILADNLRSDVAAGVQAPYVQALKDLADTNGCVLVDIYSRWGLLGNTLGLMTDTLHPNEAGHQDIAEALMDVMT